MARKIDQKSILKGIGGLCPPSWTYLGASWRALGASWPHLGRNLAHLGGLLALLGRFLEPVLARNGKRVEVLSVVATCTKVVNKNVGFRFARRFGEHLANILWHLGRILEHMGAFWNTFSILKQFRACLEHWGASCIAALARSLRSLASCACFAVWGASR